MVYVAKIKKGHGTQCNNYYYKNSYKSNEKY